MQQLQCPSEGQTGLTTTSKLKNNIVYKANIIKEHRHVRYSVITTATFMTRYCNVLNYVIHMKSFQNENQERCLKINSAYKANIVIKK